MATLASIATYPIKSLDPEPRERVTLSADGGLEGDRVYALVDDDGAFVNGKRTPKVHRLRATLDREAGVLDLRVEGESATRRFDLDRDRAALHDFLADYFGIPVSLERRDGTNMTDSSDPGPTVVSAATLREAASWFPGIDAGGMKLRLRPNLVVEGVPAFWEDRLVAGGGGDCRLRVGDVTLEGRAPVPRCVVPSRDPHTGEEYEGFRETFVRNREATFPDWADRAAFDHFFCLMVATHVPDAARGRTIRGGDAVWIEEAPDAESPRTD